MHAHGTETDRDRLGIGRDELQRVRDEVEDQAAEMNTLLRG